MTYCSIEEAWGTSFSNTNSNSNSKSEKKTDLPYGNIVPDNAREMGSEFTEVNYPESKVYRKSGKSVFTKSKSRQLKKKKSFSRTMNRLPEHSGSRNRYVSGDNIKRLEFNDQNQKVLQPDTLPSYQNTDVPITGYDKELESTELGNSDTSYQTFDTPKRPDSPFVSEMEDSDSENYVPDIIEEESIYPSGDDSDTELETPRRVETEYRERFQQPSPADQYLSSAGETSLRENTVDVGLYIITGVFLIFILDTFVKLGKKRN